VQNIVENFNPGRAQQRYRRQRQTDSPCHYGERNVRNNARLLGIKFSSHDEIGERYGEIEYIGF